MRRVTKSIGGIAILVWGFCASCEPGSGSTEWGGSPVPEEADPPSEVAGGGPIIGTGATTFGGASGEPESCGPNAFFPFAGGAGGAAGEASASSRFGCPKTAPAADSKCDWARVQCVYDFRDCDRTPDATVFTCCGAKWVASFICR